MSHAIEIKDGRVMMAYRKNGGLPWHGLGVALEDNATPDEMMKAAGLDWDVVKIPTSYEFNGQSIESGEQVLVRATDGHKLTTVSAGWEPVQNSEAFQFFDDFVKIGSMKMESAGSLKEGRVVWAQANLNDGFKLFGDDEVKGYLLFSNPHQYGASVNVTFTSVRTVCQNTLTLALGQAGQRRVNVNHRNKFDPGRVKQLMGLADAKMQNYKEVAVFLGSKKITKDQAKEYFAELFGTTEKNELTRNGRIALTAVDQQPGADFAKGTFWQTFNAVTFCTNHVFGRSNDARMASVWYGEADKLNTKALNLALKMAA